jgi:hypothetical protein
MKHTKAKVLLVHPSAISNAVAASNILGLPKNRVLLFSDIDCGEVDGIEDWRSMTGTAEEADTWRWEQLTYEKSRTRIAVINYSSGYAVPIRNEWRLLTSDNKNNRASKRGVCFPSQLNCQCQAMHVHAPAPANNSSP